MPPKCAQADKIRKIKEKFRQLDSSQDGKLDFRETLALLRKGNPSMTEKELRTLFDTLDINDDGKLDFDEFIEYLYAPAKTQEKVQEVAVPDDVPEDVSKVYMKYAMVKAGQSMMGNKIFTKLCKDCKLYKTSQHCDFQAEEADLIFTQVKPKGARTINEREFVKALTLVAEKRGLNVQDIYDLVGDSSGPVVGRTESVRLHDDKSTYTGVRGKVAREKHLTENPPEPDHMAEEIAKQKRDLKKLEQENVERTRAFKVQLEEDKIEKIMSHIPETPPETPQGPTSPPRELKSLLEDDTDWSLVEQTFMAYAGKNGLLEGGEFLKILKDCDLLDPKMFKVCDVDATFYKVAGKGQKSIGLAQFQDALKIVAEKKDIAGYFVQRAVTLRKEGPSMSGTKPMSPGGLDRRTTDRGDARGGLEAPGLSRRATTTSPTSASMTR